MFDVGFAELFLLSLIGLLVLGPERLPGVARTIGGFVRKARASWISLRNTIESELAQADVSEPLRQARDDLKRIGENLPEVPGFTSEHHDTAEGAPPHAPAETSAPDQSREDEKDSHA